MGFFPNRDILMSSRILLAAWNILVVVGCRRGREYSTDAAYLPACIDLTLAHVYGGYEDVRGQIQYYAKDPCRIYSSDQIIYNQETRQIG